MGLCAHFHVVGQRFAHQFSHASQSSEGAEYRSEKVEIHDNWIRSCKELRCGSKGRRNDTGKCGVNEASGGGIEGRRKGEKRIRGNEKNSKIRYLSSKLRTLEGIERVHSIKE